MDNWTFCYDVPRGEGEFSIAFLTTQLIFVLKD